MFVPGLQLAGDHHPDHVVQYTGRTAAVDTVTTDAEAAHPQLGQAMDRPEVLAVDELLAVRGPAHRAQSNAIQRV